MDLLDLLTTIDPERLRAWLAALNAGVRLASSILGLIHNTRKRKRMQ
ncbi:hypothetical protein [Arthrobacter sp. NPDC092385]